ncbi:hypothetical protein HN681_05080 [archaeon]|nr:hypothetical protein [archaeon]MBT5030444.1 hypothetical protein [archaeon]MBT5288263.1 hypothetical protein [archaeon]MBT7052901.1 hypothetical protein [archaeon]MBT7281758.1 hypothetical protein [archaeon]
MIKKIMCLFMIMLAFVPIVNADSDNYEISKVYINGISPSADQMVQVERGDSAQITVHLEGTGDTTDVKIKTWIGGYEFDTIEEYTETFDIENGVSYRKTLYLDIPEDLDVSSNEYTLHVEVYDSQERETEEYSLFFEAERHNILVKDIILSSSSVSEGDYLGVKVRLDNQGEMDEEDLRVTVSIPELGISNREYLDDLEVDEEADVSTVYLTIPEGVSEGVYEIKVEVEYNDGNTEVEDSNYLRINSDATVYDENAVVSFQTIKDLEVNEDSSFKVQVSNLGESSKTFYLTVSGMDADYTESVTVPAGSSSELYYTLSPEESGYQSVLVEVSSEDGVVEQKLFNTDVDEESNFWPLAVGGAFAVFVILLILTYLNRLR